MTKVIKGGGEVAPVANIFLEFDIDFSAAQEQVYLKLYATEQFKEVVTKRTRRDANRKTVVKAAISKK